MIYRVLLLIALFAAPALGETGAPRYLVLTAPAHAYPTHTVVHPSVIEPVAPQRYAYGWFGVKAQPQNTFHRGYYRDAWLWRH